MLSSQYTAGLFDGEGCVNIWMDKTGRCRFRATIVSVDENIINMLKESFGGHIQIVTKKDNFRDCLTWKINGSNLVYFLEYIEKFSIIKIKQIKVGLEMCRTIGTMGRKTSEEVKFKRVELKERLHVLNHRGKQLCHKF